MEWLWLFALLCLGLVWGSGRLPAWHYRVSLMRSILRFLEASSIAFAISLLVGFPLGSWGMGIGAITASAGVVGGYAFWLLARKLGPRTWLSIVCALASALVWVGSFVLAVNWSSRGFSSDGSMLGVAVVLLLGSPCVAVTGAVFGAVFSSRWMQDEP